jgi:chromosome segregation ATPase
MNDVQSMKAVIKEHRAREYNENMLSERNYRELIEGNKTLEDKLVKLKIEYATKAQEIEELKDTIDKVNSSLKVKDSEIMRLNKELERIHISLSESDEPSNPSGQSRASRPSFPTSPQAQSPRQAIFLKKRN